MARQKVGKNIMIECEVSDTKSSVEAIKSGADIIMLDNFSPQQAQETISYLKKIGLRKKIFSRNFQGCQSFKYQRICICFTRHDISRLLNPF